MKDIRYVIGYLEFIIKLEVCPKGVGFFSNLPVYNYVLSSAWLTSLSTSFQ